MFVNLTTQTFTKSSDSYALNFGQGLDCVGIVNGVIPRTTLRVGV